MKRLPLIILALAFVFGGYAQKKPKINKANNARVNGDLAEAKEIIDAAIVHEKTKDDGKTWYYRALIYATIDTTSTKYSSLVDNALEESVEAFNKAEELGDKDKDYYITNDLGLPVTRSQQIEGYWSYYYNMGVEGFQNEDFSNAVAAFEKSYLIVPEDTNSYVNAAYAAHNGELWDKAKENYSKAIELGATSQDLYFNLINIVLTQDKDNEAGIVLIDKALEVFPDNPQLLKSKINTYISMGKIADAEADLKSAIEAEPDNISLLFTMGLLQEDKGDIDAAAAAYKSAIEVDPTHFESNFNYGVILINEAQNVIKEANNLGMSKADQKKAREMQPLIKEKLKAALPQWERIYEIKPDETQAKETLLYIYTQLDMKEKAKEMEGK